MCIGGQTVLTGLWAWLVDQLHPFLKAVLYPLVKLLKHTTKKFVKANKAVIQDVLHALRLMDHLKLENPINLHHGRSWAEPIYTDACKNKIYTGGGYTTPWVAKCWEYRGKVKKACIAVLETDTVAVAVGDMKSHWSGKLVPLYVDNQVTMHCLKKSRSRNNHIHSLVREILLASLQYDFVLIPRHVASNDNYLADALSHGDWARYCACFNSFRW